MPADNKLVLKVANLTVSFDEDKIIEDLDFEVREGDVLAVIGPNGAGKTTLFKALLGMTPYHGDIKWEDGIRIGYVPQRMEIETDVPLTIREFLRLRGSENFSEEKAHDAVRSVLLPEEILNFGLGEISVGQRQRILIAWALLGKPRVLLFDEPTADIDIRGQESIYQLLHHLQDKYNLTIILISHDLNVVYKYAEKVLCLNRQKICFGSPQDVLSPVQMQKLYGGEHAFYHHFGHADGHQH
ncbi:MAG: metal ABC transporter ATP-binding protein [Candidatus Harrisonbacteria bacterium]|nr:metal ABC transporter ATP-binding protein [Candidatus Harrisonbacteria bacterium]